MGWFAGTISSRRLCVLAEQLPDDSRYKTARRDPQIDGDWHLERYLLAAVVNELRLGRVDQSRYHGRDMSLHMVYSPSQEADKDDERKLSRAAHDHLVAKMSSPTRNVGGRHRRFVVQTDIDRRRTAAQAMRVGAARGG